MIQDRYLADKHQENFMNNQCIENLDERPVPKNPRPTICRNWYKRKKSSGNAENRRRAGSRRLQANGQEGTLKRTQGRGSDLAWMQLLCRRAPSDVRGGDTLRDTWGSPERNGAPGVRSGDTSGGLL